MKNLKAILSTFLVAAVLFASAGFNLSRHYCLGILMEESFYNLPHSCDETCNANSGAMSLECCKNEIISIAAISFQSFENEKTKSFQSVPSYLFITPLEKEERLDLIGNEIDLASYAIPPPLFTPRKQILFQSFLI